MLQGKFHKTVTSKTLQLVCVTVKSECTLYAFREDTQKLALLKHPLGAFLARYDSTEPGDEGRNKWKFKQAGMGEEARKPSEFLHQ